MIIMNMINNYDDYGKTCMMTMINNYNDNGKQWYGYGENNFFIYFKYLASQWI